MPSSRILPFFGKRAAVYAEVIRKLLAIERDCEAVAVFAVA